jgi:hypothetical protein
LDIGRVFLGEEPSLALEDAVAKCLREVCAPRTRDDLGFFAGLVQEVSEADADETEPSWAKSMSSKLSCSRFGWREESIASLTSVGSSSS